MRTLGATLVILVVVACGAVAQSQPASRNRTDAQRGRSNQPPPTPPIQITVEAPKPSSEDAKREEDYRQREVVAQEDVASFTRWLTYLAFIQSALGLGAIWVAWRSARAASVNADAAKRSADSARDALLIANRPVLELKKITVRDLADAGRPPLLYVQCRITNYGAATATITKVEIRCKRGGREIEMPEGDRPIHIPIVQRRSAWVPLTLWEPLTEQEAGFYKENLFFIGLTIRLTFSGPLENDLVTEFRRDCLLGANGAVSIHFPSVRPDGDTEQ